MIYTMELFLWRTTQKWSFYAFKEGSYYNKQVFSPFLNTIFFLSYRIITSIIYWSLNGNDYINK